MSANDNTSTLKSTIDSATGAAQNLVGKATGSTGDQAEGQVKKDKADAEYEASQATVKVPGYSASSSGAVAKDSPDRNQGSYNQTMGATKEAIGGLIGNESLKQSGRQQNLEGQQQEAKGQLQDYTSGMTDRVTGTVGGAVAGLMGNKNAEAEFQNQHDVGKTQQRGAEHDILKNADAQAQAQRRE